jgi:hypothetical protein
MRGKGFGFSVPSQDISKGEYFRPVLIPLRDPPGPSLVASNPTFHLYQTTALYLGNSLRALSAGPTCLVAMCASA